MIDHDPMAVGATAAAGPATVAVKVIVPPRDPDIAFAETVTAGTDFATEVVEPEVKLVLV
jgi:hypothetical protein